MPPSFRILPLLLLVAASLSASTPATPASITIESMNIVRPGGQRHLDHGDRFSIEVELNNGGPAGAETPLVYIDFPDAEYAAAGYPRIFGATSPDWICESPVRGSWTICRSHAPPLGRSFITVTATAPMRLGQFRFRAQVSGTTVEITAGVTPSFYVTTDLSLTQNAELIPDDRYFKARQQFQISNLGAASAKDVTLWLHGSSTAEAIEADGWSCEIAGLARRCTLPALPAGSTSTVVVIDRRPGLFADLTFSGAVDAKMENNRTESPFLEHRRIPANPEELTKILIPIALPPIRGGYGSEWITEVFLKSSNGLALIHGVDVEYPFNTGCMFPMCPGPDDFVSGRIYPLQILRHWAPQRPGAMLYIRKELASKVALNVRVQDISRQALTWGTEIPVAREEEFSLGPLHLLNVPLHDRFRQTLRVYGPDGEGGVVRLVAKEAVSSAVIWEGDLVLEKDETGSLNIQDGLIAYPSYLQIGSVADLLSQRAAGRVSLELAPVTPGLRIWAMVSVTNNETQHVTTITPQ